jgi:hypothetical protein
MSDVIDGIWGPAGTDDPDPSSPLAALSALTSPASTRDIEAALRSMIESVNGEDALTLRSMRTDAIEILTGLEVRGAAGLVDAALALRPPTPRDGQGSAVSLADPEPWPTPVDGAELLEDIAALTHRYLVLPDGGDDVIALWVAHTYGMELWEHTAYLALTSATRRCGKTTALRVIESLVSRAQRADCLTAATLYRIVEAWAPTLLIDELDRTDPDSGIWGVLLSGHTRGATIPRCDTETLEPRLYHTYGARVLAYIRGSRCPVPDTVEDRSVIMHMSRRRPRDRRERLRSRELASETETIRRRLARWVDDHAVELAEARPELPEVLDDRAADSWEPMLAIADQVGGRWPARARELAVSYSTTRTDDERDTPGVRVLLDLVDLLDTGALSPDGDHLAAADMCSALGALPERPWSSWGRDRREITPHALGRLLRPHDVRTHQIGAEDSRVRRYIAAEIRSAAEHYTDDDTSISPEHSRAKRSCAQRGFEHHVSDRQHRAERMSASEALSGGIIGEDASPDPRTRRPYSAATMTPIRPADIIRRYGRAVGLDRPALVVAMRRESGVSLALAEAAVDLAVETGMISDRSGRYHAETHPSGGRVGTATSDPPTRRPYSRPRMTPVASTPALIERLLAAPEVVTEPGLIAEWRALRAGGDHADETTTREGLPA